MSTDLSIILKITAQNEATPILEKVTASLKETNAAAKGLTEQFDILASATTRLAEGIAKLDAGLLRLPGRLSDMSTVIRANVDSVNSLAAAYGRLAAEQGRLGGRGAGGAGGAADPAASSSERERGGGFGLGSMLAQSAVFGGAYLAYSGAKASVTDAINFNATAASTQATTGISSAGLRQVTDGIMQIAGGGGSRYDANTLLQGAYAIISTGVTNPQTILAQLKAAAASATASNSPDVLSSTSALTTVMNAYGTQSGAMKFQDVISMAINQGKADPTQVPTAMATFARSAKTAGVSFQDAAGAFAFDTLASRDAQTSGQDMDALFRLVNNPNMASRTFAKNLPGLDWGTGMVGRAGGLDKWMQNLLAQTAGPNQGLLLSHLVNNAPALAAVEGAAADPTKFSQYLADAGGTGKTVSGEKTFMASDAGKLYGATNELKTEFQKFSDKAIPLLTDAMAGLTAGLGGLGNIGNTLDKIGNYLNPTKTADQEAETQSQLKVFHAKQQSLYGSSGAFPEGPRSAAAQDYANYRNQAIVAGKTPMSPQAWATAHPQGPSFLDSVNAGVTAVLTGGQGDPGAFNFGPTEVAVRNALGITTSSGAAGGAGPYANRTITGFHDLGGGRGGMRPVSVDATSDMVSGIHGAGYAAMNTQQATTANQARAVAAAGRTSSQRKSGDMTQAGNALQLALSVGASSGTIQQLLSAYIAAVNGAGLDPATAALDIHNAQASVASYNQGLASTAAANASAATASGYQHVQAVLQVAQMTHSNVAGATSAEESFIRAHPTLWNNDPAQLQVMLLSLNQQQTVQHAAATGPNLIRPNLSGLGALQSGAMNTAALYGRQGGSADSKTERTLEAQLAAANETIAQQRQQIRLLQDSLGVARDTYEVNKQILHAQLSQHPQGGGAQHPRGHLVSS